MRNDFDEFCRGDEITPPAQTTEIVYSIVYRDLNPSGLSVFTKLAFTQFFSGLIVLLFCPQFGLGLTSSMGLMGVLMKYGEHICMAGCGALFLGVTGIAAAVFLRPEERRVISNNWLVQFSALSLLSAGVFICFGAQVLTTIGLAWLTGAILGATVTFKVGQKVVVSFQRS